VKEIVNRPSIIDLKLKPLIPSGFFIFKHQLKSVAHFTIQTKDSFYIKKKIEYKKSVTHVSYTQKLFAHYAFLLCW